MLNSIRNRLFSKLVDVLAENLIEDHVAYSDKVRRVVVYHYRSWEIAVGEATKAYELRDTDPDAWKVKEAAALDTRAEFLDVMREYMLIDLTGVDELPPRPAHYELIDVQVKDTSTLEAQSQGLTKTVKVLNRVTSSTRPELNYPTPHWRGAKVSAIRARLHSLVTLHNRIEEQS